MSQESDGRGALQVRGLRVATATRTIVDGIDLDVGPGESVAIVGESGSGKSLSARAIMGLLPRGVQASGSVFYGGKDLLALGDRAMRRVRGDGIGMLFQDPFTTLNPLMTVGAHIVESLPREKRGRSHAAGEAVRRLAEVGIRAPGIAERYPFQLSGGMRQRVGLAAALAGDPDLLIADEPTTALDATTQAEILVLLRSVQERRRMKLLLITHDLRVAFSVADRVYVLYAGRVMETGTARQVEAVPSHPYSLGLLLAEPPIDRRVVTLSSIPGRVPRPDDVKDRCSFEPRCGWSASVCRSGAPALRTGTTGSATACVRIGEIQADLYERLTLSSHESAERIVAGGRELVVEATGIGKVFSSRRRGVHSEVRALDDVSIVVARGESVGIVGESGSGKTTFSRCLLGLERPTEGILRIGEFDASDYGSLSATDRRNLRRSVQIVFQDPYSSLNPMRTIEQTLLEAMSLRDRSGSVREVSVEELLAKVGLPGAYAKRRPGSLSGGERQRVAIARALAVEPIVLVCDEPTSALDVSVQAQILSLLRDLRDDTDISFVFISHDLAVIRQIADRAYVLYKGRVVEEGQVDEVMDHPRHEYTRKLLASVPGALQTEPHWPNGGQKTY